MTRGMRTTTVREIRASLGRYLAIAAIIALGVGFFAGLRITTADMIATTDEYLEERKLFDYRLASTIGFTDAELELLRKDGLVVSADGEIRHEILCHVDSDSDDCVMAFHSITHGVNELELVEGRMPEKPDECVVDSRGGAAGHIGEKILISAKNENTSEDADTNSEHLKYNEYTIVGEVFSPIYLNYERGTTELLDGSIAGFVCIDREGFASDIYTSLYAVTNNGETIYSDEYDAMLTRTRNPWRCCAKSSVRRAGSRSRRRSVRRFATG